MLTKFLGRRPTRCPGMSAQIPKTIPRTFGTRLRTSGLECTFGGEVFGAKHDWQKHEKSHLSLERWICSATGGTCVNRETRRVACVFCEVQRPNDTHLETHNYSAFLERPLDERTFYRKEHFQQHLRLVHGCKYNKSMETWRKIIPEVKSTCGFCGSRMTTWQERADHLVEHFEAGKSISEWRGDLGFEEHISDLVENAQERK